MIATLKIVFTILLLSLCGCSHYRGVAPGTIPPPALPDAAHQTSASQVMQGFIRHNNYTVLPKSSAEHQRTARVAGKLLRAAGYSPKIFPVAVVLAGDEVNAMVLDGSSILVFKKLVDKTSEEELAAVLAHEVGHLLGKHYALAEEEQSRAETVGTWSSVLGSVASIATSAAGYGGLSDVAGGVTEGVSGMVGYGAYVGAFSRDQEYEADHIGLMLMAKAGYDPEAAISFWRRSHEIFAGGDSVSGAFFSTHPANSSRADALAEYLPLARGYYERERPRS